MCYAVIVNASIAPIVKVKVKYKYVYISKSKYKMQVRKLLAVVILC